MQIIQNELPIFDNTVATTNVASSILADETGHNKSQVQDTLDSQKGDRDKSHVDKAAEVVMENSSLDYDENERAVVIVQDYTADEKDYIHEVKDDAPDSL